VSTPRWVYTARRARHGHPQRAVDPGLITWLEEHEGLAPHEVADALEHRSGLLGLAGTADMRELLERDDDAA
jgi:acetate kinase